MEAITVAVIGLVAGVLGSLAAPWAQWGVEKRRERLAHRRSLIATWREGISMWDGLVGSDDPAGPGPHLHRPTYVRMTWFGTLSPYLQAEVRDAVTAPRNREPDSSTEGRKLEQLREVLRREVERLEQEWGLL